MKEVIIALITGFSTVGSIFLLYIIIDKIGSILDWIGNKTGEKIPLVIISIVYALILSAIAYAYIKIGVVE